MANAGSSAYDVDNSAMFNEPDDEYFTRTPSAASNQRTWTFSTWVKRGKLGSDQRIFTAASNGGELFFDANDKLNAYQYEGGYTWNYISTQVFRDPHAWYHIVQRVDTTQGSSGDRVRLYVNGEQITAFDTSTAPSQNATGYVNSAVAHYIGRYSGSNSSHYDGYLAETVLIDGQGLAPTSFGETDDNGVWRPIDLTDTLTVSSTAEAIANSASATNSGDLSTYTYSSVALGTASSTRAIYVFATAQGPASSNFDVNSMTVGGVSATRVADVTNSAEAQYVSELWRADVPSGTTGDIVVTWNSAMSQCGIIAWAVTGDHSLFDIQTTSDSTASFTLTSVPNGSVILAGRGGTGSRTHTWSSDVTENVDEVIADGVVQSGASSAKSTGGNFTVTCTPSTSDTRSRTVSIVLSPTQGAGINGFYLNMAASGSDLGDDASGKSNDWTNTNSVTQTSDSPTKNYAVLSPLTHQTNGSLSKGNTTTTTASADQGMSFSTFPVTTGQKVYIEALCSGATSCMTGCVKATSAVVQNPLSDFDALETADGGAGRLLHVGLGDVFNSDGNTSASNYAPNDSVPVTHMIALDLVNDKIYWGDAGVGASGWSDGSGSFDQTFDNAVGVDLTANLDWFFAFRPFAGTIEVNFGATAFTVSPPTGYSSGYSAAIENENRETALTIEDGSAHFQASTWSGNSSSQTVNQSGNSTFKPDMVWIKDRSFGNIGNIFDAVRAQDPSNKGLALDTGTEDTNNAGVTFASGSIAFTGAGDTGDINNSGRTYVGWQWLAGNSTASNSNGSITSTVSVNQTAGFSIVSWTGSGANATIGHGLGAVPKWIVIKNRSSSQNWPVYFEDIGNDKSLLLDTTGSEAAGMWQNTTATSTVFSVDGSNNINKSSENIIAYCWCEKPGFSKFDSYEGNGNANGDFIELGFKPKLFIAKNVDATGAWLMFDSAREPFNLMDLPLEADDAKAEAASSGRELDFLSNGVKLKGNSSYLNSANTFIYMAWAENPFAGTTPTTAR